VPSGTFRDPALPFATRVDDLISRLTTDEKISQLMMASPAIPRLDIPAYDWWNECLHGVARNGVATVFPQAIALAATWNPGLHFRVADAISTEARAKNNELLRTSKTGASARFQGLTFWSPNINIFRDPRWGRGQETYGEDPYLTGRFAVAFVHGLQGDDPRYLKTVATLKHYAVHSGPEPLRHKFSANVSERDFRETYLAAFETGVREGGATSLMSAYNAINGIPAPANHQLLTDIPRAEWGFTGAIVGDVDTVADIWKPDSHAYAADAAEASALALKAGNDLCSGSTYKALPEALKRGLITESDIDDALRPLLLLRFRLGQFDESGSGVPPLSEKRQDAASTPPASLADSALQPFSPSALSPNPYLSIPITENASPAHDALALEAARQSIVLLKNDGLLPLDPQKLAGKTVAILGPAGFDAAAIVGNYNGTPARYVTLADALAVRLQSCGARVQADPAVPLYQPQRPNSDAARNRARNRPPAPDPRLARALDHALDLARSADHIILTLGLTSDLEGEENPFKADGFLDGDRLTIQLPAPQRALLEAVATLHKPTILILTGGSAIAFDDTKVTAALMAWYYGQRGADAVADVLLGDYNPAGRLPITFYKDDTQLPPFEDYNIITSNPGRTYKYFKGAPLYAFGHGLSYTTFAYTDFKITPATVGASLATPSASSARAPSSLESEVLSPESPTPTITATVTVQNTGPRDGDEVVQIYATALNPPVPMPLRQLVGFKRIPLKAGETQTVQIPVSVHQLRRWDTDKKRFVIDPGTWQFAAGPSSDNLPLTATVEIGK